MPEKDFFFGIIATLAPNKLDSMLQEHYDKKYGSGAQKPVNPVISVNASMAAEL